VGLSGKDLVLLVGGLFLIWKSVQEIHDKLEGEEGHLSIKTAASFNAVMGQIMIINLIFSLDSVITAVGLSKYIGVMVAAVLLSTIVMIWFAKAIGDFVQKHPTVKMLALSFLILIGANLIIEAVHFHVPKGYTYFAMAFAVVVEMLNLKLRKKGEPVHLHQDVV
jgi:predicted tellurium resistance membrane protein TerC